MFAVKAPRYITHVRRLRDIEEPMANFFASGPLLLGKKLGPFLWQFPPNMKFDEARFSRFLELLPHSRKAARDCALGCAQRLRDNGSTDIKGNARLRHAVEIRNESFLCEAFIKLLRKHRVALVVADSAGKWPYVEDVTADFVYMRLHGDVELYSSGYTARRCGAGSSASSTGAGGGRPTMPSWSCRGRHHGARPVTSTAISTTTRKSMHPMTPGACCRSCRWTMS